MENSTQKITIVDVTSPPTRQADTDEQLVALWLHGRSPATQKVYAADSRKFLIAVQKPLRQITLGDVQAHADRLAACGVKTTTQNRQLSVVKSLFAYAHRIGYLPFNIAGPLLLRPSREGLTDRILEEADVRRMLALEPHERNHALLLLFYAAGLRVSELRHLTWRDMQPRQPGGQVTVFGKGGKTRTILIPSSTWLRLMALRSDQPDDAPVYRSRKGGPLSAPQVWRVVRNAALRAGIEHAVSPHFLRHAHASHALDHGAPISLVQSTLGHACVSTTGRYLHARPSASSSSYLPL